MKIRTDIVKMYKEIHGWVGIVSGLALFIAFFAGAITMFEEPLQRWASPPSALAGPTPLDRTDELVEKVLAQHPEASRGYEIHLATGPEQPARLTWTVRGQGEHPALQTYYAALEQDGSLQVVEQGPSPVADFVDILHQQVGLPFEHEISMPIMGAIALLYAIAIVSGIFVLLPSLVKDLFALRVGKNAKRMWLDLHNVLGLLSLPFHLVMALTAVVFAFHDQFYDAKTLAFKPDSGRPAMEASAAPPARQDRLPVLELVERIDDQTPGFTLRSLTFMQSPEGEEVVRVSGTDPRYGLRAPTYGMAEADPFTGQLTELDYMPGMQDGWGATVTSFFALHFGNFGGPGIRWTYFLLGIAGAFLFYTGNLLWVESRRKRERRGGAVQQTRATKVLGALTVGVPLGCIAGIAVTVAAAKPLGLHASEAIHSAIYYAVFLAFTGFALMRGAPRAAMELLPVTAAAVLLIPLATLVTLGDHPAQIVWVDIMAISAAGAFWLAWRKVARRAREGGRDSIWSIKPSGQAANGSVERVV
ncbi:PepSY-associated TM helix domain-containing protein [Alteraurantiacibacter aquimixticola]|uniref:PepSY domain-containing protein n=1 Tax=Alteraurantiacibacter aquimixticola TaxID=2489173 RepID=A0A4T3F4F2_9SPHN|nr:PepSY-associated TM helix domain-containing protein [Alteraurantiacibacter aquimixticola]TIX51661.1 PepSY domain-containing protein [Alteraurantiacibacter aquimixticola]